MLQAEVAGRPDKYYTIHTIFYSVLPKSELKAYGKCIFWVEPESTSKPLAPPQSYIKVK